LADSRRFGPLDCNPSVSLIHQVGHVRTTNSMNGDALSASNVADNRFSTNGIAAPRAIHQKIVIAFDFDRSGFATLAKHASYYRSQRADWLRRLFHRSLIADSRRQFGQDLPG